MGASRADPDGMAVPGRAVGRDDRPGTVGLRGGRQRGGAFEPVTMIANPGADARAARAACSTGVEIVELPLDDSWLRDCGPIYVYDDSGTRIAVHFAFNAWGEKFPPWDRDAAVGRLIAEHLGDRVVDGGMVLEGGVDPHRRRGDTADHRAVPAATRIATRRCHVSRSRTSCATGSGWRTIVWLGHGTAGGSRHRRARRPDRGVHAPRGERCCRPCLRAIPTSRTARRTAGA